MSTISPRGQRVETKEISGVLAGNFAAPKPSQRTLDVGTVTQFPAQPALPLPVSVLTPEFQAVFWGKVNKTEGCWEWVGNINKGYGRVRTKGSRAQFRAQRVAYALGYGTDPGDLLVCHECDNPRCCRPDHLFLGTHADNAADKVAKGRWRSGPNKGEKNGNAKLTESDVQEIIRHLIAGRSNAEIAKAFTVGQAMVSRIRVGRAWRFVADEMGYVPAAAKGAPKSGRTKSRLVA